jgi:hypothetical protein
MSQNPSDPRESDPELADVVQKDIYQAEAIGGPLVAVERLLYYWLRHPEALEPREQWYSIVHEFERRLTIHAAGWTDQEGFEDPTFRSQRCKTLDDAFSELTKCRAADAGMVTASLRRNPLGFRVYHAVHRWMDEHPEKTLLASFADLAGSKYFAGESAGTLNRLYYNALHILNSRPTIEKPQA